MMNEQYPVTDADLAAYVNNQLDPARRAAVGEWLTANPGRAAEIDAWLRQNETIHALFGGIADEPVPARLNPHRLARSVARGRRRWAISGIAAALLFTAGLGAGWFGNALSDGSGNPGTALAQAALSAHAVFAAENRHAVEVAAAEEPHLVSWLSNRIGKPLVAPDLTSQGFTLIGGRLLPFDGGGAAQLMYQDADGGRITLFITGGSDVTPEVDTAAVGGLNAYYWLSDALDCAMVGTLPADQLKTVAASAWRQLVAAI
jgi:anti-sigma factor RsiW